MVIKNVGQYQFCAPNRQKNQWYGQTLHATNINKDGNPFETIHVAKALTREPLICFMGNISVTKPYQIVLLIRLHVTKSTLLKCILSQHIFIVLSLIHLPVRHSSTPPPSLYCISPPAVQSPSRRSSPTLFPHAPSLFLSPTIPLFLPIHTTESLLIICDLLKYILRHSLSLTPTPTSLSGFLPLCPVLCWATSSHYSFPLPFPHSQHFQSLLSLCSPPSLYRREVTNMPQ